MQLQLLFYGYHVKCVAWHVRMQLSVVHQVRMRKNKWVLGPIPTNANEESNKESVILRHIWCRWKDFTEQSSVSSLKLREICWVSSQTRYSIRPKVSFTRECLKMCNIFNSITQSASIAFDDWFSVWSIKKSYVQFIEGCRKLIF